VGAIATDEDSGMVDAFLNKFRISAEDLAALDMEELTQGDASHFHMHLRAFEKGFVTGRLRQVP